MKKILIIIFISIFLVSCQNDVITTALVTTEDITLITFEERDYSEFLNITIDNPEDQLTQVPGTYYIYFYGSHCIPCGLIKNEVLSKIELLVNDKVYLVEASSSSDINDDIDIEGTPSLVLVTNNQVTQIHENGINVLEIIDSLT
ncbi:thioredoxin domain-containing protein [Mycoplasmatota bacterium WC30]